MVSSAAPSLSVLRIRLRQIPIAIIAAGPALAITPPDKEIKEIVVAEMVPF